MSEPARIRKPPLGTTAGHRAIDGIHIAQRTFPPVGATADGAPWSIPSATEDFFLLTLQRQGHATLQQDGRTARLAPGDMALCSGMRACQRSEEDGGRQTVLTVPAPRLRAACPEVDALTATAFRGSHPLVALMALVADSDFDTPYQRLPARAAGLAADAIVATLAGCLVSLQAPAQPDRPGVAQFHLKRIRQHVLAHLDDTELSVAKVGLALGMSAAHLHRLFAAEAQTFSVWLWETRLQACHLALRQPAHARLSISQLAFRHGYVHAAHFSRVYRARYGMTARQWRAESAAPTKQLRA